MTKKPETTHPLSRLLDEFRRAAADDLEAAEADRSRVAAARARIEELQGDGARRKKTLLAVQEDFARGDATAKSLEDALAAVERHERLVASARQGFEAVRKSTGSAEAALDRKRADFTERAGPLFREALESKLAGLAHELRAAVEDFLRPVSDTDEGLARALTAELPGMGAVVGRVESALRDAEAAAQRSGPRQFAPGPDGQELPVQERSAADVLREAAERRTDATGRRAPVGIEAKEIMQ